ncbi:MAG: hypothetical protein KC912_04820 [Proteobacteria bacterium]|nr:hypothetical protein [Pseudomonadota bacterium]
MTRWALGLALLGMVGCKAAGVVDDDTDTADTADTAEVEPPCEQLELVGKVVVPGGAVLPAGSVSVDLIFVDLTTDGLATGSVKDLDALGTLSAGQDHAFSLCIAPTPEPSDVYAPEPDSGTDFKVASYVFRVFEDDGNGSATSWVGASMPDFLVWAEGTIPVDWVDAGMAPGWNVVTMDVLDESVSAAPLTDSTSFDIDADLLYVEPPPLGFTIQPDLSSSTDLAVGLWNINRFIDSTAAAPAAATVAGMPFTSAGASSSAAFGTLGQPPADHLMSVTDFEFVDVAFYMGAVWSETDGSNSFESPEVMHANTTSATPERNMVYFEAQDWRATVYMGFGLEMGWNVFQGDAPAPWQGGLVLDVP